MNITLSNSLITECRVSYILVLGYLMTKQLYLFHQNNIWGLLIRRVHKISPLCVRHFARLLCGIYVTYARTLLKVSTVKQNMKVIANVSRHDKKIAAEHKMQHEERYLFILPFDRYNPLRVMC